MKEADVCSITSSVAGGDGEGVGGWATLVVACFPSCDFFSGNVFVVRRLHVVVAVSSPSLRFFPGVSPSWLVGMLTPVGDVETMVFKRRGER